MNFAKTGELIYSVAKWGCGKKRVIISNPEGIGQHVFVSDAKNDTTIRTTIKDDEKCHSCASSHLGIRELPQHWIGRKAYVRPYQVFSVKL